jgi:type I restriction enzyme, S subunit
MQNELKPELRFSEFENDWEEKRLGELFSNSKSKGNDSVPIYSVSQNKGLVPRESLDRNIQNDAESGDNLVAEPSDLVYNTMRMWQGAVGMATTVCMVSPAYVVLSPNKGADSKYFMYFFERLRSRHLFTIYSYGLTLDRLRLYYKDFSRIKVKVPPFPEQEKIANFLSALDARIQALTKKKTLLEQYKKGVMRRLFSQEIRFKDEQGQDFPDWEEKRLGGLLEKIQSGKDKPVENGDVDLFGSTGVIGKCQIITHNGKFILIARVGANAGTLNLVEGKFGVTDNTLVLSVWKNISLDFIFYLLSFENLNKLVFGSGQPLITGGQLKQLKFYLPILEEQNKIANFLINLDKKINDSTQKIEAAQTYKKGLLQKMFV